MKNFKFMIIVSFYLILSFSYYHKSFALNYDWQWTRNCSGGLITTDKSGNIYLSGNSLSKYDAEGDLIWSKQNNVSINDITTDISDNIYVTGLFEGTIQFDNNYSLTSNGKKDIFVIKYDSNGNIQWLINIGDDKDESNPLVASDSLGNMYVFSKFDTSTAQYSFRELSLLKFDSNGTQIWRKTIATGGYMLNNKQFFIDNSNNIYMTGTFDYTNLRIFNNTLSSDHGWNGSDYDIFIVKLNADEELQWVKQIGGKSIDSLFGFHVDSSENFYITGEFLTDISFDNITFNATYTFGPDIFIAKYDKNASCKWAKQIKPMDSKTQGSKDIVADENYVYMLGYHYGRINFGSQVLEYNDENLVFIAMFAIDGGFDSIITLPEKNISSAQFLTLDSTGNIYCKCNNFLGKYGPNPPGKYKNIKFYQNVSPNSTNINNWVSPNKKVRFKLEINNNSSQNLLSVHSKLTSQTNGITITDDNATFNNILQGSSAWSVDEYEIFIDETVQPGTILDFTLETSQEFEPKGPWKTTFNFPVSPLITGQVYIDDDNNPDSSGNNNDIAEPGETVELLPFLNNVSQEIIENISGELISPFSFIHVWNNHNGVSGLVKNILRYNFSSNQPQPIEPEQTNIQPELDYVFNYKNESFLQEFELHLQVVGYWNDIEMKWLSPISINKNVCQNMQAPSLGNDITIYSNDSTSIDAGNGYASYLWHNGTSSQILQVNGDEIGIGDHQFSVTVTDQIGCAQTSFITITVLQLPLPDLIIQNAVINPENVEAGSMIIVSTLIKNQGLKTADSNILNYYLSKNTEYDESDVFLTHSNITKLEQNSSDSIVQSFIIPDNTDTGNWYVLFEIDASHDVNEGNELNNVYYTPITINQPACQPDWQPVVYTNSTVAYCIVTINGNVASENDIVGAFVNGECRAKSEKLTINDNKAYVTFNIQGVTIEDAFFRVWDSDTCIAYPVNLVVQTNPGGDIGSYPNLLNIDAFSLIHGDFNSNGKIDLSDAILILKLLAGFDISSNYYNYQIDSIKPSLRDIIKILKDISNDNFTIKAMAEKNGTITPEGLISVKAGSNSEFIFTPATGYKMGTLWINDSEFIWTDTKYAFNNLQANQSMLVSFIPETLTINASYTNKPSSYLPGESITFRLYIESQTELAVLGSAIELPEEWSYNSVGGIDPPSIVMNNFPLIELTWVSILSSVDFTFTVDVPDNDIGDKIIHNSIIYRILDDSAPQKEFKMYDYVLRYIQ